MHGLRRWLGLLGLDQIRCASCLRPFSPAEAGAMDVGPRDLCVTCRSLVTPYTGPRCPRCGFPFSGRETGAAAGRSRVLCGGCLADAPPWRAVAYHGLYRGALRDLILRFKFGGDLALARPLGAMLAEAAICLPVPDAMLAMPQHPAHLRRRGFNQAHELARALHALTGIPLRTDILARRHDGIPQASLNARLRAGNVRGAFGVDASAAALRLWLIDDVMTTGNTLREATRTLLQGGAAEVCVLAVARTPRVSA